MTRLGLHGFPLGSLVQTYVIRGTGYAELPLGVNEGVNVCV